MVHSSFTMTKHALTFAPLTVPSLFPLPSEQPATEKIAIRASEEIFIVSTEEIMI